MESHATFTIDEIFSLMDSRTKGKVTLPTGHTFRVTSQRLVLFRSKGIDCATCGIAGTFFSLDSHNGETPHLNLYAEDASGAFILMTKDHIKPKAKGGTNELENYQTMCTICNCKKSDNYDVEDND